MNPAYPVACQTSTRAVDRLPGIQGFVGRWHRAYDRAERRTELKAVWQATGEAGDELMHWLDDLVLTANLQVRQLLNRS